MCIHEMYIIFVSNRNKNIILQWTWKYKYIQEVVISFFSLGIYVKSIAKCYSGSIFNILEVISKRSQNFSAITQSSNDSYQN